MADQTIDKPWRRPVRNANIDGDHPPWVFATSGNPIGLRAFDHGLTLPPAATHVSRL